MASNQRDPHARREIRPPTPPPPDKVLGYANPQVEREVARRWRRLRREEWLNKASVVVGIVLFVGVWLFLRLYLGITICIIPVRL